MCRGPTDASNGCCVSMRKARFRHSTGPSRSCRWHRGPVDALAGAACVTAAIVQVILVFPMIVIYLVAVFRQASCAGDTSQDPISTTKYGEHLRRPFN